MRMLIVFLIVAISFSGEAQSYFLESTLDAAVNETSGILFLNNTLVTHNDSANSNDLYDIDTATGSVLRTITLSNVANVDWEDLAEDENYIYIGDFGNFDATRTNLRVLRILKSDYLNSDTVTADIIDFSYSEQTDFSVQEFTTNFDAEALIHYNDNLYIFTKNWANTSTNIYQLPKTPGSYSISVMDVVASNGLVTGATPSTNGSSIVLCGYDFNGPFVLELNGFSGGLFSNGYLIKTSVSPPVGYSFQTEAITPINANEYYVTAEAANGDLQGLYSINLSTLGNNSQELHNEVQVVPNPAQTMINLSCKDCNYSIYSINGRLLLNSNQSQIDVSQLDNGYYFIKVQTKSQSALNTTLPLIVKR